LGIEAEIQADDGLGMGVPETVDWMKRAKKYCDADDGENLIMLVQEIWQDGKQHGLNAGKPVCYCKKCKALKSVINTIIDEKDIMTFYLECGHKRHYLNITHSRDYKEDKDVKENKKQ